MSGGTCTLLHALASEKLPLRKVSRDIHLIRCSWRLCVERLEMDCKPVFWLEVFMHVFGGMTVSRPGMLFQLESV